MTATITTAVCAFTFNEARGTHLLDWIDPRGAFTLHRARSTNAGLSGFRVEFVCSADGKLASVEFWLGDTSTRSPADMAAYSVTITGDFAGTATTRTHWWGARCRHSPVRGPRI
jgi:hypothetical protein